MAGMEEDSFWPLASSPQTGFGFSLLRGCIRNPASSIFKSAPQENSHPRNQFLFRLWAWANC